MTDSYRNPFSGGNASQLNEENILEYWWSPFPYKLFADIKESDIFEDPNNIVLMGGRNTGKTMFLRYCSYKVQERIAMKDTRNASGSVIDYFVRKRGIGFYVRIDGPILRSFSGHEVSRDKWNSIFAHYLELVIARSYVDAISSLYELGDLDKREVEDSFLPQASDLIDDRRFSSLGELLAALDQKIREVDLYRGNVAFHRAEFKPARGFASQTLSFGIPSIARKTIRQFRQGIRSILLIDEYENFLEDQQRIVNTMLRFSNDDLKFRIGMRLEGFRTYKMISSDDFIKEGREYRKVVFEEVLIKDKDYSEFLRGVARKRLEAVTPLKEAGKTDIVRLLDNLENLEQEALDLAEKGPDRHFEHFKRRLPEGSIEKLSYRKNPLMELLNIIWVLRGTSPEKTKEAMEAYISGKMNHPLAEKYKMDYVDKYKLSLMILLCAIHKQAKKYYSFNTFRFLSSGIVGNFIELCRRAFAYAEFENKDEFVKEGKVTREQQNKAARDFAQVERLQLTRIEEHGPELYKFVVNLGNIFRDLNRDERLRYPETNQFSADSNTIQDPKYAEAFKAALRWSAIQKKTRLQQAKPGQNIQDIYTINRIFSPAFEISYRTRGGYSVSLSSDEIIELMTKESVNTKKFLPKTRQKTVRRIEPPDLFSQG